MLIPWLETSVPKSREQQQRLAGDARGPLVHGGHLIEKAYSPDLFSQFVAKSELLC